MKILCNKETYAVLLVFILAFWLIPVSQFDGFILMPGDIGDGRLNNYFLENAFQFLTGGSDSLWHPPFFYPFPYVLGFSDNLFGSSPAYILARLFTEETDTAFQLWFYFGYVVNFLSAYYSLRRLKGSALAATIGSVIFAFALPVTAHAGHAQLHYRFGIPLAILFLTEFYNSKAWHYLLISGGWLVWQFYAGVYMGFFALLLMATMSMSYLLLSFVNKKTSNDYGVKALLLEWHSQSKKKKMGGLLSIISLLILLLLLFHPYIQVSHLYGAKRGWSEISIMLPRLQSYFLADRSWLSNFDLKIFSTLPMRHEHQMFIGFVPLILALAGFFIGSRKKNGTNFTLIVGMLGLSIVLTLYVGGLSFWYILHKLPLVSAIRAVTRLDQALLFPIAYLSAIGIDNLRHCHMQMGKVVTALVLPLLILEAAMISPSSSTKDSWRERFAILNDKIPKHVAKGSVLFFAQDGNSPEFADELDAMWVSLVGGFKTMNGYSGLYPPDYDYSYGNDCSQIFKRALSYLDFSGQLDNTDEYHKLVSRVIPVGFDNCNPAWLQTPPSFTSTDRVYSPEEFQHIASRGELVTHGNKKIVRLTISNSADHAFSAKSSLDKPIRISWRFIDASGQPLSDWENRRSLPFDIPSKGSLEVNIILSQEEVNHARDLQVSLVQELVFWAHDIGIPPLTIPLN